MGELKRVTLQFNMYDIRHKQALAILRSRPRHMSELVVNAVLHFVSCPECQGDVSSDWIRDIIKAELAAYRESIPSQQRKAELSKDDVEDMSGLMDIFREKE